MMKFMRNFFGSPAKKLRSSADVEAKQNTLTNLIYIAIRSDYEKPILKFCPKTPTNSTSYLC